MNYKTTCREELLTTMKEFVKRTGRNEFTVLEALDEMHKRESVYKESTIRTHLTSKCRVGATAHHAVTFEDYVRVGKGKYALHSTHL